MNKVLVLVLVWAGTARAGSALDKPAMTATPAELLALAKAAPAGDWSAVVLRDEHQIDFDAAGKRVVRWRTVFVVRTQAGADDWGTLIWSYSPFYQDKPAIRARVIEPDGTVAELDPSTISDSPEVEKSAGVFSDRREMHAPLPRLQVGAVVEQQVVMADRVAILGAFGSSTIYPGYPVPVQSTRVALSAPAASKARQLARGLDPKLRPRHEVKAGRESWVWDLPAMAADTAADEPGVPSDAIASPYIALSVAPSWGALAKTYRALVDERIASGPVTLPAELPRTASVATVAAITAWLHRQVRYTGIEFGEASHTPWAPAEVLKRGFGDCKDKATVLVAMLRQAGIRADLAVLSDGPGQDIDPQLPAFEGFDHAIVRARVGTTDVWIDATEDGVAAGRLPPRDQGRRALIVADDTTDLVITPRSSDHGVKQVRTFEASEDGRAKVTEVSESAGAFGDEERAYFRDTRAEDAKKGLRDYVTSEYSAKDLDHYAMSPVTDLDHPFTLTTVGTGAGTVFAGRSSLEIYLYPRSALDKVPGWLGKARGATEPPRKHDYQWWTPHTFVVENRIDLPPGFAPPAATPARTRQLGPASLVEERAISGQTLIVRFTFSTGKPRITAKELEALRDAIRALRDEEVHITVVHTAWARLDAGDAQGGVAEAKRLIALHPREARHHDELATIYLLTGAGAAARREVAAGVKLEPKTADAYDVQGWVLRHDLLGRDFGVGFDRAGSLAAYAKAKQLDPKHAGAAAEYAEVLSVDERGQLSWRQADLAAVADAWKAAYAIETTHEDDYMRALLRAGRAAQAEEIARKAAPSTDHDALLLAAIGARDPAAAVNAGGSMRSGPQVMQAAGRELMMARRYKEAYALFSASGALRGTPYEAMFAKTARHDEPLAPGNDPKRAAVALVLSMFEADAPDVTTSKNVEAGLHRDLGKIRSVLAQVNKIAPKFMHDVTMSVFEVNAEGKGPWRLTCDLFGEKIVLYAATIGGTAKVFGSPDVPYGVGEYAWQRIAAKDLATARLVLDWVVDDAARAGLANPMTSLWGPNVESTDKNLVVAAAALSLGADPKAVPALIACESTAPDARARCAAALMASYVEAKNWKAAEGAVQAWAKADPKAKPTDPLVHVLVMEGAYDRAQATVDAALAAAPNDKALHKLSALIAARRGDVEEALKRYEALARGPGADAHDKNQLAWFLLRANRDLGEAVELARAAVAAEPDGANIYNTLSAVEAAHGELRDAIKHTVKSLELRGEPAPADEDWFVDGLILEQLGLRDDAIAVYRKVDPKVQDPTSARALAAARLKALGATK